MDRLNEPVRIARLELKNRLVMPPMATHRSTDGTVNDAHIAYYRARAGKHAPGLIITEHNYIDLSGRADPKQLGVDRDDKIQPLSELAQAVHAEGDTKIFVQINHAGRKADGETVYSSSSDLLPGETKQVTAMSREQIHEVTREFAQAALRVKKAGMDGVEIHSAHGYLLNQFFSPVTNHRTDEYGGSLLNRIRFHLEVISAVRKEVGEDFPVILRLGCFDIHEGGVTMEDVLLAAKAFEEAGIRCLDITGGIGGYNRTGHSEPGWWKDFSSAVKQKVSIPVILTGGVKTGAEAEALLEEGSADLIGVGRELMRDASWPLKNL
jgi:NADPH2 dehydrogenase